MVNFKEFKGDIHSTARFEPLDLLNKWLGENPAVKVINIETQFTVDGGRVMQEVSMEPNGIRVWFMTT